MGLFRRGTKLLKLGSGLRDCCCRPEQPEECWCPDWCRYYWDWEGNGFFPAGTFLENQCSGNSLFNNITNHSAPQFGITVGDINSVITSFTADASRLIGGFLNSLFDDQPTGWIAAELQTSVTGYVSESLEEELFGVSYGGAVVSPYNHTVIFQIACFLSPNGEPSIRLRGFSGSLIYVQQRTVQTGYPTEPLVNFYSTVDIPLQSQCVSDKNFACLPGDILARHLENEIGIVFDENNVTVGGTAYPWNILDIDVLSFPRRTFAEGDAITTDYRVENKFPTEGTLTLRQKSFCVAGDCDCTESLTGMTVTFEGKTFTYGSLEQFVDGVDTWEETIPGLFRRTTRETCDGTYVAAVKIAEVFCETVDGTDYWTVYLDSECYERDEATCPASADARRIMQWTGVFTCGGDGKPGGTPHSATDAADPPDLDSNTTLGTPAAECAGDLDLPAISFG